MEIREAAAEEAGALARLVNAAFVVERFFKRGDRTTPDAVRRLMDEGTFLVVDGEGGRPAACVFVRQDGRRGYFGMLSVDPAAQGRGLGRGLIDAVEARLHAAGCVAVDIHVVNLRTDLPPFYRRIGYVESGTRPFPDPAEATQPCHMVVMTKSLRQSG
jgi:GNAT superfamily N-acetyltransferase